MRFTFLLVAILLSVACEEPLPETPPPIVHTDAPSIRAPEPSIPITVGKPPVSSIENEAFRLTISSSEAQFTLGVPIHVTTSLRNLSDGPVEFVWQGLAESLHLRRVPYLWPACGAYIADHAPGFEPDQTMLEGRAEASITVDVTTRCEYIGEGVYELWGSYCHHGEGRVHGTDDPDWCLTTEVVHIRVLGAAVVPDTAG